MNAYRTRNIPCNEYLAVSHRTFMYPRLSLNSGAVHEYSIQNCTSQNMSLGTNMKASLSWIRLDKRVDFGPDERCAG